MNISLKKMCMDCQLESLLEVQCCNLIRDTVQSVIVLGQKLSYDSMMRMDFKGLKRCFRVLVWTPENGTVSKMMMSRGRNQRPSFSKTSVFSDRFHRIRQC